MPSAVPNGNSIRLMKAEYDRQRTRPGLALEQAPPGKQSDGGGAAAGKRRYHAAKRERKNANASERDETGCHLEHREQKQPGNEPRTRKSPSRESPGSFRLPDDPVPGPSPERALIDFPHPEQNFWPPSISGAASTQNISAVLSQKSVSSQLNLPRRGNRAGDQSGRRADRATGKRNHVGRGEIGAVLDIEALRAELQVRPSVSGMFLNSEKSTSASPGPSYVPLPDFPRYQPSARETQPG